MDLLIVESPTKAKTLSRFLGKEYMVKACMGHVRDLPGNKMNVDVEGDFEPVYEVVEGKETVIADLVSGAKKAKIIFLAMDPDREGEAIAFHVRHILKDMGKIKKKNGFRRITFHQITKSAVEEAIGKAGEINMRLVEAQQARRVLDRLAGYTLSPVLWKKVRRGLSAGRVQSVALRLVVEREREIEAFTAKEYWEVRVLTKREVGEKEEFWVNLWEVGGEKVVKGSGDERKFLVGNKKVAAEVVADLKKAMYRVEKVIRKKKKSRPKPPYTTSTLQQAAANRLGWTAKRTMRVAQSLYEKGLITYHRTDSTHLAAEAVAEVRNYIKQNYAEEYLPEKFRFYQTTSKSAQEAHEAIRPTEVIKTGAAVDGNVDAVGKKLYGMIWRRMVACQMSDAVLDATTIDVMARGKKEYLLRATGSVILFEGWRVLYKRQKGGSEDEVVLPEVDEGEGLKYREMSSEQKFTQPPARYNDASLIRQLEELGIGRPSTYAPTISTLIGRAYMERMERRFKPTAVGLAVADFLVANFKKIMDYGFTANMEDELDKIAEGKRQWVPVIREFWKPFSSNAKEVTKNAKRVTVPTEKTGRLCPECGRKERGEEVIRIGRFGKFLSCSRFPECKYTARFLDKVRGMKCPDCKKGAVVVKRTRTGRRFWGCERYPECNWASWQDPKKMRKKDKKK